MKKLNPSLYKNKIENPNETVYEIITAQDNLGWGLAIADIGQSELHVHHKIKEIYTVLEGRLEMILNGKSRLMKVGESMTIFPKMKHEVRSINGRSRIVVIAIPPWTQEDHILVK